MLSRVPKELVSAVESGALRSSARCHGERSLLARLELTSYLRSSTQVNSVAPSTGEPSCGWWFEHGVFGLGTGLLEGVQLASEDDAAHPSRSADWVQDVLLQRKARLVATKMLVSPDRPAAAAGSEPAGVRANGLLKANFVERHTDVLPLGSSYQETLGRLGRHTRRNLRKFTKETSSRGVAFSFFSGQSPFSFTEINQLAHKNRPRPIPARRIKKYERYIDTAGNAFRSALKDKDGQLISYCYGFMHDNNGYILLQLNDQDWHTSSLSLVHRGHLMEALGERGMTAMIFVHGCAGVLHHSCLATMVSVDWAMRSDLSTRILASAATKILPTAYYQRAVSQMLNRSDLTVIGGYA